MNLDNFVPEPNSGCWLWLGGVNEGYGRVRVGRKQAMAHRVMYEREVGPIPKGLTLDHLCRVRSCVNPAHLEPVTTRENTLRGVGVSALNAQKVACVRGHRFDSKNTYHLRGKRSCRACHARVVRRGKAAL